MAVVNVQTPYEIDHFRDVKGSSSIPLINNVVSDEDLRKAVQKVKARYLKMKMGFQKKKTNKQGRLKMHFLKPPGIFRFFTLSLEIPDKTNLHS